MKVLTVAFLVLIISGCTSVTNQTAPIASFDTLEPGNALIIVERKYEHNASANDAEVLDNGKSVGIVGIGYKEKYNKLQWQRPAGVMKLKLSPRIAINDVDPITTNVEEGKIYTFVVSWNWGKSSIIIVPK